MDKLVSGKVVAEILGISYRTFQRYEPRMIARGLRKIRGERRTLFRLSDVDRFINRAAETGELLGPRSKKEVESCQTT